MSRPSIGSDDRIHAGLLSAAALWGVVACQSPRCVSPSTPQDSCVGAVDELNRVTFSSSKTRA